MTGTWDEWASRTEASLDLAEAVLRGEASSAPEFPPPPPGEPAPADRLLIAALRLRAEHVAQQVSAAASDTARELSEKSRWDEPAEAGEGLVL